MNPVSSHGGSGGYTLTPDSDVEARVRSSSNASVAPNEAALQPAAAGAIMRPPRLNRHVSQSGDFMRRLLLVVLLLSCGACYGTSSGSYLFVWAGDAEHRASDFLAVLDANPTSPRYGAIVASLPTGMAGSHPHHTELEMSAGGHLLANGFRAGRTWLFDLTRPLEPRLLTVFDDLAGFSHPHTYIRLANGNVLATFQYQSLPQAAASNAAPEALHGAAHGVASSSIERSTGGLVEMDERGTVIRAGAASDDAIPNRWIYPYSVLPLPAIDRAISTTTDMDEANTKATSEWLQLWRLSDLTLLRSIALEPGPRGNEHHLTGEPRLLADGRSIYVHTFNCGLYLLRGIEQPEPEARFVHAFDGRNCGVPIRTGNFWLQTVPDVHAVVVLDITDPEHPREVSRVTVGDDEAPHWMAIDPTGRRIVLNSGGYSQGNRLFVLNFDPANGRLTVDERFRDPASSRDGVDLSEKTWPHGFSGKALPHGAVFSR